MWIKEKKKRSFTHKKPPKKGKKKDLWNAVTVGDHAHDVVEREEGVALDLSVDVLALRAQRQQLHQVDVVLQGAAVVCAVPLRPHQLDEGVEGAAVIVEQQHLLSCAHQLRDEGKTQDQNRHSISNAIHFY